MPKKPRQPPLDLERLQVYLQNAGVRGSTLTLREGHGELSVPRRDGPLTISDTGKMTNGPDDRIAALIAEFRAEH